MTSERDFRHQILDKAVNALKEQGSIPAEVSFEYQKRSIKQQSEDGEYRLACIEATSSEPIISKNEDMHYFGPTEDHIAFLRERESNAWIAWGYRDRENSMDHVFLVPLATYLGWSEHIAPSRDEQNDKSWDSAKIYSGIDSSTRERYFHLRRLMDEPGEDVTKYLLSSANTTSTHPTTTPSPSATKPKPAKSTSSPSSAKLKLAATALRKAAKPKPEKPTSSPSATKSNSTSNPPYEPLTGDRTMYDALKSLLKSGDYTVAESFSIPPREARYQPIPEFLSSSDVGAHLQKDHGKTGLWNHQALALEKIGNGKNVVVSTGTASGKSLIFQSASFHQLLQNLDSQVLVFYPLKALANDQLRKWQAMAKSLGLPEDIVGRIDGSVDVKERDKILDAARVVIMTPDVCHAWMMSRLSIPIIKEFLRKLEYIIMDEAHTLEGVFGSNFSFLLRRMLTARRHLLPKEEKKSQVQIIAATATIESPENHMKTLTGMDFESITNVDDGSPHEERFCAHVVSPDNEEMPLARNIQSRLLEDSDQGGFITFVDSRKGVETLAQLFSDDAVMPYRAGYAGEDRAEIEQRLQTGQLRGVVSTSALELGIDLPHLVAGLNIGVPPTRKSYRQRVGRVGRSDKGAFLIIAPHDAFKGYGTSFEEYHAASVEPSYLYLDNRFMQFAHSRCLVDELEALGAKSSLPSPGQWPEEFERNYANAQLGADVPAEFDAIAQLGGDTPQRNYPLRNMGMINYKIGTHEENTFGEAAEHQALRECYPGATYLHLGKPYEVMSWNYSAFHSFIKVRKTNPTRKTRPRVRVWINAGIMATSLMEENLLRSEHGFIAECQMQITEKVEGYTDQTETFHPYQELRQRNPNMRPRQRNFRTSGVILCVQDAWFKDDLVRKNIADKISAIFCREYSVLPQDIDSTTTNIKVRSLNPQDSKGHYLVFFDQTYGSLRLTERLFTNFKLILDRLRVSADIAGDSEKNELLEYVSKLDSLYSSFSGFRGNASDMVAENSTRQNHLEAFKPGSVVFLREKGSNGTDAQIVQISRVEGHFMYQIKIATQRNDTPTSKEWVAIEQVEPSANPDEWSVGWWNTETEEFEDEA